jgi:hypothetical protein
MSRCYPSIEYRPTEAHFENVAKVLLDGTDVTKDCFYADEERGEVQRYAFKMKPVGTVIEGPIQKGHVEIILKGEE